MSIEGTDYTIWDAVKRIDARLDKLNGLMVHLHRDHHEGVVAHLEALDNMLAKNARAALDAAKNEPRPLANTHALESDTLLGIFEEFGLPTLEELEEQKAKGEARHSYNGSKTNEKSSR